MASKSNKKKNSSRYGNPAKAAAVRKQELLEEEFTPRDIKREKLGQKESTISRGFVPSASLPEKPEATTEKAKTSSRTIRSPRKSKFIRAGQITVVVAVLGGLVLTSFGGAIGQPGAPINTGDPVLVDQNGLPLDGSEPVDDSAVIGENLPSNSTEVPVPPVTDPSDEAVLDFPSNETSDGATTEDVPVEIESEVVPSESE